MVPHASYENPEKLRFSYLLMIHKVFWRGILSPLYSCLLNECTTWYNFHINPAKTPFL